MSCKSEIIAAAVFLDITSIELIVVPTPCFFSSPVAHQAIDTLQCKNKYQSYLLLDTLDIGISEARYIHAYIIGSTTVQFLYSLIRFHVRVY